MISPYTESTISLDELGVGGAYGDKHPTRRSINFQEYSSSQLIEQNLALTLPSLSLQATERSPLLIRCLQFRQRPSTPRKISPSFVFIASPFRLLKFSSP
jgi:hypothetical protein